MSATLHVEIGQWSTAGSKPINQDACAVKAPSGRELETKGVIAAIADGIGSSDVSDVASQTAVQSVVSDYYSTSAAWSVKNALSRVVSATNAWLHARTDSSWARYDKDRGYVCTLTSLVIRGHMAYCLHVGDTRAYRYSDGGLECLTHDHHVSGADGTRHLARAIGSHHAVEQEYTQSRVTRGDRLLLSSDGVHEYLDEATLVAHLSATTDCQSIARHLCDTARANGSPDDLTAVVLGIIQLPEEASSEWRERTQALPLPPELRAGEMVDEFRIIREIHRSHRSRAYLARHRSTNEQAMLKIPSTELGEDPAAIERFLAEEWIAARVTSAHVVAAFPRQVEPTCLYAAFEYIEGGSLRQWMRDQPRPDLQSVRDVVRQIGSGVRALHRQEMIHQDLRPENVMIDRDGSAKLIDLGAVKMLGLPDAGTSEPVLGTEQYTAPEMFLGAGPSERTDVYSLAVVTYELITGELPYGPRPAQVRRFSDLRRLRYRPVAKSRHGWPEWLDDVLARGSHPLPEARYKDIPEFIHALDHGEPTSKAKAPTPIAERDPVTFWQTVAAVLVTIIILQWALL